MKEHLLSRMRAAPALTLVLLALCVPSPAQDRGLGLGTSQPGRYYALVIGNNNYQSVPKLKTAENDAREVEAILKTHYGFQTRLLLNVTRQQIISALAAYRRELNAESNLLIYYAGHGVNDREVDKAYWLPVDASKEDPSNWISADDITTTIKAIPSRHVLIVSDSCYSGTLTRGLEPTVSAPSERERFLDKMLSGRSRTLMASGGNEPVADGGGGGNHSVFANALLRGLKQMERERFTAAELFREFVEVSVAGRADQTPEYNPLRNSGHESGDFVFVRVRTDGKTVEVTVNTKPSSIDPAAIELSFWESIKNSSDPEDFNAYLRQYPRGSFVALANNKLRSLAAAKPAATPAPGADYTTEDNTTYNTGTILRYFGMSSASAAACRAFCTDDDKCVAYTYVRPGGYTPGDPPVCYLMQSIGNKSSHTCCLTGIKKGGANTAATAAAFATPKAAIETFIRAAAARDVELLSQCFATEAPREFDSIREKRMTKEELDRLSTFIGTARIVGVNIQEGQERAVVNVELPNGPEQIEVKRTPAGWKIVDF